MRIDSCRKCGIEMEIYKMCPECDKPIQFHCKKCNQETDIQVHKDVIC